MSLKTRFGGKFQTTTEASLKANDPKKKKGSNRFTYLRRDITIFKPIEDQPMRVRLLPIPEVGYFAYETKVHFAIGPDYASSACPWFTKKEPCPLCSKSKEYYDKGDKVLGKQFSAKLYNLTLVIDRLHPEKGVQVWPISGTKTLEGIHVLMTDPEGGIIEIDDLDAGRDLFFNKGKVGGSEFSTINELNIARKESPLSTDVAQATTWLQFILDNPMEELLQCMSTEELIMLSFGVKTETEEDDEDEDDDKEDDKPATKVTTFDSDEDDDEEEAPPVVKSKTKKAVTAVDDGEEDDDEEEPSGASLSGKLHTLKKAKTAV